MSNTLRKQSPQGNPAFDAPLRKARGIEEIRVTPEIAQHWLQFNTSNRGITNARVAQFQADMQSGNWADNGETIRFAYGKLLDGQHRLTAILLSGTTIRMHVVHGLDPESQVTMDTGRGRTPRDILSIEGLGKWESGVVGSGIHAIIAHKAGGLPSSNAKFTNREVRNFFLEHRSGLEASIKVLAELPRNPALLPFSRALTFHYLFSEVDREQADAFFCRLYIGDGLSQRSPVFHLRQRLTNDMVNKKHRSSFTECAYIIRAWNGMRRGSSWKTGNGLCPKDSDSLEFI